MSTGHKTPAVTTFAPDKLCRPDARGDLRCCSLAARPPRSERARRLCDHGGLGPARVRLPRRALQDGRERQRQAHPARRARVRRRAARGRTRHAAALQPMGTVGLAPLPRPVHSGRLRLLAVDAELWAQERAQDAQDTRCAPTNHEAFPRAATGPSVNLHDARSNACVRCIRAHVHSCACGLTRAGSAELVVKVRSMEVSRQPQRRRRHQVKLYLSRSSVEASAPTVAFDPFCTFPHGCRALLPVPAREAPPGGFGEYARQLRIARETFLHQRVYDVATRRVVPLSAQPKSRRDGGGANGGGGGSGG
eukprot:4006959-Pleurochrysis_carterae.AAC.1